MQNTQINFITLALIFCTSISNGMQKEEFTPEKRENQLNSVVAAIHAFEQAQKNAAPFVNKKLQVYLGNIKNNARYPVFVYSDPIHFSVNAGTEKSINEPTRLHAPGLVWQTGFRIQQHIYPKPPDAEKIDNNVLDLYLTYEGHSKNLVAGLRGFGYPCNQIDQKQTAHLTDYFGQYINAYIDLELNGKYLEQSIPKIRIEPLAPAIQELLTRAKAHYVQTKEFIELPKDLARRLQLEITHEELDLKELDK